MSAWDLDLRLWTPAYLATSAFETTSSGKFMPWWMRTLPPFEMQRVRVVEGESTVREHSRTPFSWSGLAQNRTAAVIELAIAYSPGWEVRVDSIAANPVEPTGLMRFPLRPGVHSITAQWKRTLPRWVGDVVSGLSLLACVITLGTTILARNVPANPRCGRRRLDFMA